MTNKDIQKAIHDILDSHDGALAAIRLANEAMGKATLAMQGAISAHDSAIVSAIDANRAALRLLDRIQREDESV